jgi:glycine/serine hydroxymethyltransferase
MKPCPFDEMSRRRFECLRNEDPEIFDLLRREYEHQTNVLCLVASSSVAITHITGLVVSGIHAGPINHAHLTTTCNYKQLHGLRGGLMGKDCDVVPPGATKPFQEFVQKTVLPLLHGTPLLNSIVAKARALARAVTSEFNILMDRVVDTAGEITHSL